MVVNCGGTVRGGAQKTQRGDGNSARRNSRWPLPIQKKRHLRHVAAVEEVGADEGVEVAIENLLYIAAFDFGAMVFD
jgi:hypothetical protein